MSGVPTDPSRAQSTPRSGPSLPTGGSGATDRILQWSSVGTCVFVVVSVVALAARHKGWSEALFVSVALLLFALGVATALWAYAAAVERSRTEQISVGSLFLLSGGVAPALTKRWLWLAWVVQIVTAFAVGIAGSVGLASGDKNILAFGALVPMFGVGCNGLWAVRRGTFPQRTTKQNRPKTR